MAGNPDSPTTAAPFPTLSHPSFIPSCVLVHGFYWSLSPSLLAEFLPNMQSTVLSWSAIPQTGLFLPLCRMHPTVLSLHTQPFKAQEENHTARECAFVPVCTLYEQRTQGQEAWRLAQGFQITSKRDRIKIFRLPVQNSFCQDELGSLVKILESSPLFLNM